MAAARSKDDEDVLWELLKRIGKLEQKFESAIDAELLKQKNHSLVVQLALKRQQIVRLCAEKRALTDYIKEMEKLGGFPTK